MSMSADTIAVEPSSATATWGESEILAVQELVDRMEAQFTPPTPREQEWFGWIPLRLRIFFAGMRVIREEFGPYARPRLLEVGSGIGTKLGLAHALGFNATGIERHEPYLEVCRQVFPHVEFIHASAERFPDYDKFDVVFCNRVASTVTRQDQLNRRIAEAMRPGALLFALHCSEPRGLERVGEYVYRTPESDQGTP